MVDIYFIIFFVRFNNKSYSFCYFIFHYDDNRIFHPYVSYMSVIRIYLTNFELDICCCFCHNYFGAVKELHKFLFPITIYSLIGTYTSPITYRQRIPNMRTIIGVISLWWSRYKYSC